MLFLDFILGLLPIIWLVIALVGLKWPGYKAAFGALLIACIEGAFLFNQLSVADTLTSVLEGFLFALWPIVIVIIAAVFTYNLCVKTGSIERIKQLLTSVTSDKRLLMLLIGWCFGGFMEGMAGFGTAVAIPASMLWGLGFDPIIACLVCLIANATPTPFGSIGIPTVTLTNLGLANTTLSLATVLALSLLIVLTPFVMVFIYGKGFKAFKGITPIIFISAISFLIPEMLVGAFVGAELAVVAGSVVSLGATIFASMKMMSDDKIPEEYKIIIEKKESGNLSETLKALSPFILIFAVLLCTSKLVAPVNTFLGQFSSSFKISTYEGAGNTNFAWVNTPGVLILLCAIIGGLIQKASIKEMFAVFKATLKQMVFTVLTMLCILGTARVMQYSGMILAVANLFTKLGSIYPFFAPVLGALGTFVTGSGTSSSALFGGVQMTIAAKIGVNEYWLVAANSLGVATGKMMAPQSIAIGLVAVGEAGRDGELLKKVVPYACLFIVLSALICFFGQYIWLLFI